MFIESCNNSKFDKTVKLYQDIKFLKEGSEKVGPRSYTKINPMKNTNELSKNIEY